MRVSDGFTLTELLIVIAAAILLAAIAYPNLLRSRIAANESAALESLRQIRRAQTVYASSYPTSGFAGSLRALASGNQIGNGPAIRAAQRACLLDNRIAEASSPTSPKDGYWFSITPSTHDSNGIVSGYVVTATPSAFNKTGVREFCSLEDGIVHFRISASDSSPVTSAEGCLALAILR